MRQYLIAALMLGVMMMAGESLAGSTLTVRLVAASNVGQGMGVGLGDVSSLLRDNLPFKTFQLLASRSMSLPADGPASLSGGIVVYCSGSQRDLNVVIEKGGSKVLQSTTELRDGIPLLLVLPASKGKRIVILLAK